MLFNISINRLPRFLLFLDPYSVVCVFESLSMRGRLLPKLVTITFVAVTTVLQPLTWNGEFDFAVPFCGFMCSVLFHGSLHEMSDKRWRKTSGIFGKSGMIDWSIRMMTFAYSMLAIPLGLMDFGTPNMFSGLRIHGGSNHLIIPTNLLQKFAFVAKDLFPAESSVFGQAFGGFWL